MSKSWLVLLALPFAYLTTAPALAAVSRVEVRAAASGPPRTIPRHPVEPETLGQPIVDPQSGPQLTARPLSQEGVILNCESDNTIDLSNTLVIDANDFAGSIFEVPAQPKPYVLTSVSLGLVDFQGQTLPATVGVDVYEDDLAGNFQNVIALDVTIDGVADGGEIFEIDLTPYDIRMSNDFLILYGDLNPIGQCGSQSCANLKALLPTGDASPRCFEQAGNAVCSVHLPASCPPEPDPCPNLYIYGVVDAEVCFRTQHHILSFDLVLEATIEQAPVAAETSSWSAVKARF